ncbi:hypothetical protein [uncultured Maricaulis sp.]|uniref:hypothetical protein n=1 Tax=uncultured Maricaulis sp. TaxID=174710 RepID=UPI0030DCC48D|tara:strand:- start:3182 stop:3406 length:225 start_codon:yes stop_codon:yes gene_type:complete
MICPLQRTQAWRSDKAGPRHKQASSCRAGTLKLRTGNWIGPHFGRLEKQNLITAIYGLLLEVLNSSKYKSKDNY